jgi:hypothetical protein
MVLVMCKPKDSRLIYCTSELNGDLLVLTALMEADMKQFYIMVKARD